MTTNLLTTTGILAARAIADSAYLDINPRTVSTHFLVTVILPELTAAGLDRTACLAEIERRAAR